MGIGSIYVLRDIVSDLHVGRSRLADLLEFGSASSRRDLERLHAMLDDAAKLAATIIEDGNRRE